jgi:hypothetical protein
MELWPHNVLNSWKEKDGAATLVRGAKTKAVKNSCGLQDIDIDIDHKYYSI